MSPKTTRPQMWVITTALVALTLIVYLPVIWADFIEVDDWEYVSTNVHINTGLTLQNFLWSWTHALGGNWHPVTAWSHMLDCQLFGLAPKFHHLENVLFHCANVVLLFYLVRRFGSGKQATLLAWLVAATFAVHPLHVESVAWISERKDVLSAFFFLLTLHAYLSFATEKNRQQYALCLLWFALGLMSKPMLVTLPFVLLLLDFWPLRRTNWKALVLEKWPFFALSIADSVITIFAQNSAGAMEQPVPLRAKPGFILEGYWFYFEKFFAPKNLAMFYPPNTSPNFAITAVLFVGFCALTLVAFLVRRRAPAILIGWFWFVGMLVPVIGIVHAGTQAYADRFSYLPSIGLSLALIWPITHFLAHGKRASMLLVTGATCALAAFTIVTQRQVLYWQNTEALYTRATTAVPNNREATIHFGGHYEEMGLLDKAASYYTNALALNADGFTLFHLGKIYVRKHDLDAAQHCFETALVYAPDRPEINRALGRLWDQRNDSQKALEYFRRAVAAGPDYLDGLRDFAWVVASEKTISSTNTPEAIAFAKHAAQLEPDNPVNLAILAGAQARAGQFSDAIQTEQSAIKIAEAKGNRGVVERCRKQLTLFQSGKSPTE